VDVFTQLVGQPDAVAALRAAASGQGTTHSWLFVGPPGSGRSVAARSFAAALQCTSTPQVGNRGDLPSPQSRQAIPHQRPVGCGECPGCHTTLTGTHPDVQFVVPEGLSIPVAQMRSLVLRAATAPSSGRWQILVVEDADRLTEAAGNALLKAVEEPPLRTVFLLCAPSDHPDDVPVTIRSRCRLVTLRQPAADAIAELLVSRDGIDPSLAAWVADASQGHVGRARWLARDAQARERRSAVLTVPRQLTGVGACFDAANNLIAAAEAEAEASTATADAAERAAMETALGAGGTGKGAAGAARGVAGQLKELERRQKSRATRAQRDALDRALLDLAGFYRDVLAIQWAAPVRPIHKDVNPIAVAAAQKWRPETTLRRLESVLECRTAIDANVKPRIAVEAMMLRLWQG
jgi:DNA polymerase III subunit delta'